MKKVLFFLLPLVVLFANCGGNDDDDASTSGCDGASMTATIDGVAWEAGSSSFYTTLVSSPSDPIAGVPARLLSMTINDGSGKTMILVINNLGEGECMDEKTLTSIPTCTGGLCEIGLADITVDGKSYSSGFVVDGSGTFTITDCSDGKVSGTFDFTAEDIDETEAIEVSGSFSNVCFIYLPQ